VIVALRFSILLEVLLAFLEASVVGLGPPKPKLPLCDDFYAVLGGERSPDESLLLKSCELILGSWAARLTLDTGL